MSLWQTPLSCPLGAELRGHVAVMGNLDGVHLGHRALIAEAAKLAEALEAPLAAVTFAPHPRRMFKPDAAPFLLTPLAVKAELLEEAGCRNIFALPFNAELAAQSPETFVTKTLRGVLGLEGLVTGSEFQFGQGRSGTADLLARIAEGAGITYRAMAPVGSSAGKYSSSAARKALEAGRPEEAAKTLGYSWFVDGEVLTGRKLARTLGFPTANLALGDVVRPLYGVYAVLCDAGGAMRPGVANIGVRPTVDGKEERLEVHLFDWNGDLYGQKVRCHFAHFIREERPMAGLDALKAQIAEDSAKARALLGLSA